MAEQHETQLDYEVCERARLARDPRFDGRFFIGVKTTGVFCRPICPVRAAKAENVLYFPTAAAASEAGFRPCLRCRPEAAPGTPAWLGTAATVSRALRLIADGALDDGNVTELAERVGVGPRHLTRLFRRHLGATPRAVAATRRLLFAKKLIDETELPLAQVALSAGFGSLRRFNTVIRDTYQRTPGMLRRSARQRGRTADDHDFVLNLPFRAPYDWAAITAYLTARATPGVEQVTPEHYVRSIRLDGQAGRIAVSPAAKTDQLELRVAFPDPKALFRIVERVRQMFDLGGDPATIGAHLARDAAMVPRLTARPGLRLPGAWDGFELTIRAILGQQVTVKGATTLAGRLADAFGEQLPGNGAGPTRLFPTPAALAEADVASIGLPKARARSIQALAAAVRDGNVRFDRALDAAELERQLTQLPGIGAWTAQYVAMRWLHEPDAFPASDLGLIRAAQALGIAETAKQLAAHAETWRPWRAYAAIYLWQGDAGASAARTKPATASKRDEAKDDVLQPHG